MAAEAQSPDPDPAETVAGADDDTPLPAAA